MPQGQVDATLVLDGERQSLTGVGYHDHNWGNYSMIKLMNNWYWARAKIGEYTVIACYITAEKDYGYTTFPVFMLARDGRILADDATQVHFHMGDVYTDDLTASRWPM